MDFQGNMARIIESIQIAKARGATYRIGPELEVSGYGCEDHFLEIDTFTHSFEVLAEILRTDVTDDILVDIGMPVLHKNIRYNARVLICNRQILLIRPKMFLANDGNYHENRHFFAWSKVRETEEFILPTIIRKVTGQQYCPIGDALLQMKDTIVGTETCEELFVPKSPHIAYMMNGCEILGNGSGSHHSLKKLQTRVKLINNASAKGGGAYVYSNSQGCDGGRLFMDGSALISFNGQIIAQSSQFSVKDVEVVTAVVDLSQIRAYRLIQHSRSAQAEVQEYVPRIKCDFALSSNKFCRQMHPTNPIHVHFHEEEAEIAYGPACYLWDYVRRSKAGGYFLPLSGGLDSSSVATVVGVMCQLVYREGVEKGNATVLRDLREVCDQPLSWTPKDNKEIANLLFHTCYMGTENSSPATRQLARDLAEEIGAYHLDINIDTIVSAVVSMFSTITGRRLQYEVEGGTIVQDLALQNIQARLRMVLSYLFGQTLSWIRGKPKSKPLLVLASANLGECLRGYYTKYDCSSGDLNPIGCLSKGGLRKFLHWASENAGYKTLDRVLAAKPTAELRPAKAEQIDEVDMGLTYEELDLFGRLRKAEGLGPVSMFKRLAYLFPERKIEELAAKVKFFHTKYAINRHKVSTLTPTYHMNSENCEDSRFDMRPFLLNAKWDYQFKQIDMLVEEYRHEDCSHADEETTVPGQ